MAGEYRQPMHANSTLKNPACSGDGQRLARCRRKGIQLFVRDEVGVGQGLGQERLEGATFATGLGGTAEVFAGHDELRMVILPIIEEDTVWRIEESGFTEALELVVGNVG